MPLPYIRGHYRAYAKEVNADGRDDLHRAKSCHDASYNAEKNESLKYYSAPLRSSMLRRSVAMSL